MAQQLTITTTQNGYILEFSARTYVFTDPLELLAKIIDRLDIRNVDITRSAIEIGPTELEYIKEAAASGTEPNGFAALI